MDREASEKDIRIGKGKGKVGAKDACPARSISLPFSYILEMDDTD